MTDERTTIGAVGRQTIRNIEELRNVRGLSMRDLAARMGELGRPVGDSVLHRQSTGKRRIDADDLMAFAIALGVNTNALLLPRDGTVNDLVELTPDVRQRAWVAWAWADAQLPLPTETVPEGATEVDSPMTDVADFVAHARPKFRQSEIHASVRAIHELLKRVLLLLDDLGNRETFDYREEYILRSLRRVQVELEEVFSDNRREVQRSAPDPAIPMVAARCRPPWRPQVPRVGNQVAVRDPP